MSDDPTIRAGDPNWDSEKIGASQENSLQTLLIPVPPMIEEALGYTGSSRFVAFYWNPVPFRFLWTDSSGTQVSSHGAAWFAFAQHRRVHPFLEPFNLGREETSPDDWLLLDRVERVFSVGSASGVSAFLNSVPDETLSAEYDELDCADSTVIQAVNCALVQDWLDDDGS